MESEAIRVLHLHLMFRAQHLPAQVSAQTGLVHRPERRIGHSMGRSGSSRGARWDMVLLNMLTLEGLQAPEALGS
jgi:hypothetical protein